VVKGWYGNSHKHSLASRGIKSKYLTSEYWDKKGSERIESYEKISTIDFFKRLENLLFDKREYYIALMKEEGETEGLKDLILMLEEAIEYIKDIKPYEYSDVYLHSHVYNIGYILRDEFDMGDVVAHLTVGD